MNMYFDSRINLADDFMRAVKFKQQNIQQDKLIQWVEIADETEVQRTN